MNNKFGQPDTAAASDGGHLSFEPPSWAGNPHLQTIWPNLGVRRDDSGPRLARRARPDVLESEDGDRLRIWWSCHPDPGDPDRPVLVVLHGLTGCAAADNVMAVAAKGFAAGFDVVRVDLRNSQADHPSLGIGHAGRSEDLRAVVAHVRSRRPGAPVAVLGFSLGGNIALKAAGEYGGRAPRELVAVAVISVPIDLDDACRAIDERRGNWVYRTYFVRRLARRYRRARARHPDRFPPLPASATDGIRAWDDAVVAPLGGFEDAADYYARSSALRVIDRIRVPTLLVHSRDDPFIPFGPFEHPEVEETRHVHLLDTRRGGHVGFWAAAAGIDPDRFWAENRGLQFCAERAGLAWPPGTGVGAVQPVVELPTPLEPRPATISAREAAAAADPATPRAGHRAGDDTSGDTGHDAGPGPDVPRTSTTGEPPAEPVG